MSINYNLKELRSILSKVLEDSTIEVNEDSELNIFPNYDSLTHVYLVSEVEKAFECRFTTEESTSIKSVRDILKIIARKDS